MGESKIPEEESGCLYQEGDPKPLAQAERYLKAGDCQRAKECLSKILARDPWHLGALEILAKAMWRLGDLDGVIDVVSKLTLVYPYEPGYFLMQSQALRLAGREMEARQAFRRYADANAHTPCPAFALKDEVSPWGNFAVVQMDAQEDDEPSLVVAAAEPPAERIWPN